MEPAKPTGQGDYVVSAGDSIASIAAKSGLLPDALWNDPANADLKNARDAEVLLPGDRVTVMAIRTKTEARATGARYVFTRVAVPCRVTIVVEDEEGSPFASKKYELRADDKLVTGTTDDKGKIECDVPPSAVTGELKVWLDEPGLPNPWVREVQLGALHPKNDITGVVREQGAEELLRRADVAELAHEAAGEDLETRGTVLEEEAHERRSVAGLRQWSQMSTVDAFSRM